MWSIITKLLSQSCNRLLQNVRLFAKKINIYDKIKY